MFKVGDLIRGNVTGSYYRVKDVDHDVVTVVDEVDDFVSTQNSKYFTLISRTPVIDPEKARSVVDDLYKNSNVTEGQRDMALIALGLAPEPEFHNRIVIEISTVPEDGDSGVFDDDALRKMEKSLNESSEVGRVYRVVSQEVF